jgi:hypothetical protein
MGKWMDVILKAAIVIGLGIFLWLYATSRQVGRYAYYREGELEYVLDTSTGVVYQGGYAMNHLTGKEGPVDK